MARHETTAEVDAIREQELTSKASKAACDTREQTWFRKKETIAGI